MQALITSALAEVLVLGLMTLLVYVTERVEKWLRKTF